MSGRFDISCCSRTCSLTAVAAPYGYAYDAIGNRSTLTEDGSVVTTYKPNDLNQYDRWDRPNGTLARQGFEYDADGNLTSTWLAGDMDGNGQTGFEDINPFVKAVSEGEAAFCLEYPTMCDNFMHADVDGNGSVGFEDINPFVDLTTYGNAGAARTYTWDAANRLSAVAPALDASLLTADHRRVEFAYDYRNRMIAKQTYAWNPNAQPPAWELSAQRKFVWSDWLLLLELDGLNSDAVVRKYTWGLDLAGLNGGQTSGLSASFLEAAGGIGGLLATKNEPGGPATHAALTCDANGNVTQAFQWSTTDPNAALVAHYEYDPYGNRINTPDPSEYDQPFRFSTKMYDPTSELSYYGYRHYSPALGRWIKRDPADEKSWTGEYRALQNAPTGWFDPDGRQAQQDSASTTQPSMSITVRTTRARAGFCGSHEVLFDFSLTNPAPCDGYIVQHVDFRLKIYRCNNCQCNKRNPAKTQGGNPFYEAFPVSKGDTLVRPDASLNYTDYSRATRSKQSTDCGEGHALGTLRFFCSDVTGDLGGVNRKGKQYGWAPGKKSYSGPLPSRTSKPRWWKKGRLGKALAEARRSVYFSWDCCCAQTKTSLTVYPAVSKKR